MHIWTMKNKLRNFNDFAFELNAFCKTGIAQYKDEL